MGYRSPGDVCKISKRWTFYLKILSSYRLTQEHCNAIYNFVVFYEYVVILYAVLLIQKKTAQRLFSVKRKTIISVKP